MSKKSDGDKQTSKNEPVKRPVEPKVSNTIEWIRESINYSRPENETTVFQTRPTPPPPKSEKK